MALRTAQTNSAWRTRRAGLRRSSPQTRPSQIFLSSRPAKQTVVNRQKPIRSFSVAIIALSSRSLTCFHARQVAGSYSSTSRALAFMHRNSAATARRVAIASAENRPCLKAFRLPFGAPGDFPPRIRQRPFGIAGDRHGLPFRVRAPHRGLRCIGNCIGLTL